MAGLAPQYELETDEVPDSMVSEFSSLTTPYCWVITEDTAAGYDGAEPSAVGKSGPDQAVADDVTEALTMSVLLWLAVSVTTDAGPAGRESGRPPAAQFASRPVSE